MRVMFSTIGVVQGGRVEEAVGLAVEAAALVRGHGAEVRFFLSSAAGEQVNTSLWSMEFESPEAMGDAFDKMAEDTDLQAFTTRINSPGSASVITSQSMAMEIPIRTPKAGQGGVLEVHTSTIAPGRMEEAVAQSVEVCDFVEANGAVNARLIQLTYSGMASGMAALTWEVENMSAHARLGSAWFSDAGLAIQAKANGASPPSTPISSALYTSVPV